MAEPEQQPGFYKLGILFYIFQILLLMSYKCICGIDNMYCTVVFIIIGSKHSYSGTFSGFECLISYLKYFLSTTLFYSSPGLY